MAGKKYTGRLIGGGGVVPPHLGQYERLLFAIYEQAAWDIKYAKLTDNDGLYNYFSAVEFVRKDPYGILNGRMKQGFETLIRERENADGRLIKRGKRIYEKERKLWK